MKPLIYIAGPISKGDWMMNCRRALESAEKLIDAGFAVHVPQLSILWHLVFPHPQPSWWLDNVDFAILARCDAMLRLPGESVGSDMEVAFCEQNRIPVYLSVEDLRASKIILQPTAPPPPPPDTETRIVVGDGQVEGEKPKSGIHFSTRGIAKAQEVE